MMQIAGYLARRIVCRIHPHDTVRAGERIGLIMFGSRVDHFIPPDYRVAVKIGERVRAGESIIGELLAMSRTLKNDRQRPRSDASYVGPLASEQQKRWLRRLRRGVFLLPATITSLGLLSGFYSA